MIPKNIVAIGASSCEGKGDVEGSGFVGRLRRWHEANNSHNSVYNLGIKGDTTRGILKRLESEARPRRPHLIILQLGSNDFYHEGSPTAPPNIPFEEFKKNLDTIVKMARSLADVMVISPFPIDEKKTTPVSWKPIYYFLEDLKKGTDATKEYCEKNNIPYVNIFDEWAKQDFKQYMFEDGLHANSLGHQKIFEVLIEKINSSY